MDELASIPNLKEIMVALPSIDIQHGIVEKIEAERKLIDGCRQLVVRYEEKVKKVVDGIWVGI
jgi:restriction endonuclease S subunit